MVAYLWVIAFRGERQVNFIFLLWINLQYRNWVLASGRSANIFTSKNHSCQGPSSPLSVHKQVYL